MANSFVPGKLYQHKETRLVVFALATTESSVWEIPPGPYEGPEWVWLHYMDGTGRMALWLVRLDEFVEVLPGI
jgi:hypothetical protein